MRIILFLLLIWMVFAAPAGERNTAIVSCMSPNGHHMYYDEFTCPLGGEKFKALRLGTHSTYGRHFDLSPVSYMKLPPPIPVCPSNGFVMYKENFSKKELDKIKSYISSQTYRAWMGKNTSGFLYAKILHHMEPDESLIFPYLRASWEADGCDDKLYRKYALLALKELERTLAGAQPKTGDQKFWTWHILRANFYRRLGRFEQAEKQLNVALHHKQLPPNLKPVLQLLQKHIREKSSKQEVVNIKSGKK